MEQKQYTYTIKKDKSLQSFNNFTGAIVKKILTNHFFFSIRKNKIYKHNIPTQLKKLCSI